MVTKDHPSMMFVHTLSLGDILCVLLEVQSHAWDGNNVLDMTKILLKHVVILEYQPFPFFINFIFYASR